MFFASNLNMEIGKTIGLSIRSEHLGSLFFAPFGGNTFSKTHPKQNRYKLFKVVCSGQVLIFSFFVICVFSGPGAFKRGRGRV